MDSYVLNGFTLSRFSFVLKARDPLVLPAYKGSTFRGGFGNAFNKVVCTVRDETCDDCILKEKCIYSYIFETPPPADTQILRKYEKAPHPFVIEPPLETQRVYKPGDTLIFHLLLIGKAVDYLPYFIYTFEELGKIGIVSGMDFLRQNLKRSLAVFQLFSGKTFTQQNISINLD